MKAPAASAKRSCCKRWKRASDRPLDRDTIDLDMRRIFGRGDFETVNYAMQDIDGKQTLIVLVKEKAGAQLRAVRS